MQQENDENIRIQPLVLRRYGSSAQFGIQSAPQRPASDQRLQSHSGRRQKPEVGGLIVGVITSPLRTHVLVSNANTPIRRSPGSLLAPKKA
jgi:hypothetical protein